jgi:glycosyltransferase involved in cell wall biosynthesis
LRIHLITYLSGFPFGTAAANRIYMMGKAIMESGNEFRVYTNNIFSDDLNEETNGIYKGIPFRNLHGNTRPIKSRIIRSLLFLKGFIRFLLIIRKFDPENDIIYIYAHGFGSFFTMLLLLICKISGLKTVQEINEWYHNDLNKHIEKIFVEGPILKLSTGAIVISENINGKVKSINPEIETLVIPVLGEPFCYENNHETDFSPYCFWMGLADTYLNDILLIIQACAKTWKKGYPIKLIICGPYKNSTLKKIENELISNGYPGTNIKMTGYVDDQSLIKYYLNAYCFIIPLWNTERSSSRFPTKMAAFMFSQKPLITCKIGEPGNILLNDENVLFFEPGDPDSLSGKIDKLFTDKALYDKLGQNASEFANQNFHYSNYSAKLNMFFKKLIAEK